ncbi:MAG: hypothetical protein OXF30_01440 [Candidatus Saccharibacteria bacterium]|nr:hypothetical protein [Candidatus Saccharibacteria bacterium]
MNTTFKTSEEQADFLKELHDTRFRNSAELEVAGDISLKPEMPQSVETVTPSENPPPEKPISHQSFDTQSMGVPTSLPDIVSESPFEASQDLPASNQPNQISHSLRYQSNENQDELSDTKQNTHKQETQVSQSESALDNKSEILGVLDENDKDFPEFVGIEKQHPYHGEAKLSVDYEKDQLTLINTETNQGKDEICTQYEDHEGTTIETISSVKPRESNPHIADHHFCEIYKRQDGIKIQKNFINNYLLYKRVELTNGDQTERWYSFGGTPRADVYTYANDAVDTRTYHRRLMTLDEMDARSDDNPITGVRLKGQGSRLFINDIHNPTSNHLTAEQMTKHGGNSYISNRYLDLIPKDEEIPYKSPN